MPEARVAIHLNLIRLDMMPGRNNATCAKKLVDARVVIYMNTPEKEKHPSTSAGPLRALAAIPCGLPPEPAEVIQRQLDWLARSEEVVSKRQTVDGEFIPEPPGPRPRWVQLWTHDKIPYYWDRDERRSQWEDPRGLDEGIWVRRNGTSWSDDYVVPIDHPQSVVSARARRGSRASVVEQLRRGTMRQRGSVLLQSLMHGIEFYR